LPLNPPTYFCTLSICVAGTCSLRALGELEREILLGSSSLVFFLSSGPGSSRGFISVQPTNRDDAVILWTT
jgi:hypothetical protein